MNIGNADSFAGTTLSFTSTPTVKETRLHQRHGTGASCVCPALCTCKCHPELVQVEFGWEVLEAQATTSAVRRSLRSRPGLFEHVATATARTSAHHIRTRTTDGLSRSRRSSRIIAGASRRGSAVRFGVGARCVVATLAIRPSAWACRLARVDTSGYDAEATFRSGAAGTIGGACTALTGAA